jgi:hypothetical protein
MSNNKVFIILFLMLITSASAFSQATTNSPYSRYGIGIIRPQSFSQNFGMGGTGIGQRSDRGIGLLNPASFSAIAVTTFDIGFTNNSLWLEDGSESQYQNNPYIDHIAFAFPIMKNKWGMSFGFLPYSNMGYDYDEVINDSIAGDISYYSQGEGAINKAYFGNGFAINVDSTSLIGFGVNSYFLFGSMEQDEKIIYGDLPGSFNVWKVKDIAVSGFGFDFGLQYQKRFKNAKDEEYKFTAGATYTLANNLGAKRSEIIRSFSGSVDFGTIKDTSKFDEEVEDVVQLPAEFGFGISFEKQNKWLMAVDYKMANWGTIASNDALYDYKSNYSLAAGIQLIPKYDGHNYLQRMAYRVGAKFSNSYIAVNDVDWSEYGITFGIGMPVRKSGSSYPRLNLGFEYGNRGTTDSGLIKEKFFNFNIGVTINAVWFGKRKYE